MIQNKMIEQILAATVFVVAAAVLTPNLALAGSCDSLIATISVEQTVTCYGGSNGALSAEVSGGVEPYQYLWNTGASTSNNEGLSAGIYSVNITDANECATVALYSLTEPEQEIAELAVGVTGCEATNGSILVIPSGENEPYQFSLNNGDLQSESNFDNLAAGVYAVGIVNGSGCLSVQYGIVNTQESLEVALDLTESNSCFGDCVAAAELMVNGAGDLEYEWYQIDEDGNSVFIDQQEALASGLCAGTYYAVVEETGGSDEPLFWSEDFGSGCNQGQIANGIETGNGTWTISNTGTNETLANSFFISAAEQIGDGNCGAACGGDNNRTLHVSNTEISVLDIVIVPADGGAVYLADATTNVRAESPTIDCSGRSDIELSFDYIEGGQALVDNATLWYFDGTNWQQLDDPEKTTCCGGPCNGSNSGSYVSYSVELPASANDNPEVKIGFQWINNNDGQGTDPSFAVDNLELIGTPEGSAGCSTISPIVEITEPAAMEVFVIKFANVSCNGGDNGIIQVQGSGGTSPYSYLWDIDSTSSVITNLAPGEYTVTVTDDNGCEISSSYLITEPSEPEVVGFTYDDDNLTVQFTNTSTSGSYLWDFGDGNTSADINPIHVYAGPGMHEVCLTLFSDCGDIENCQEINLVTTGINSTAFTDFVVFPNPASDQFNFEIADQEIYTLTFYDVRSRLQFATTLSGQRAIDISEWASGIYFFVLRNENGAPVKNGKVIVQD